MKLYAMPPSPNTIKVVAVADMLGISMEMVPVDVASGAHKTPEYLAKNPNGLMPCLEDGDFHLWESNAIMIYMANKTPGQTLWPSDAKAQADVSRWMFWGLAHWGPAIRPFMYENIVKLMFRGEASDPAEVAKGVEAFHPMAKVLDGHLAKHAWLVGDHMTLADIAVGINLVYAVMAKVPWDEYKHMQEWFGKMAAMPSMQKAVPQMAAR